MTKLSCDVAIIGAGTAGLAAERSAREAGARTLLIDDAFAGTTCARIGCMPSKLLIAAGRAAHAVRSADRFGIEAAAPGIDGAAVMRRVRRLRDDFVADACKSIASLPEGVAVQASARFLSATRLALSDGRSVAAKTVVIATGSRPQMPDAFAALGDLVLTNETVFELPDLPASLAVIGAGPLGLELAQAFARLGVDTEVFDEGDHVGGLAHDGDAAAFASILSEELTIRLAVKVKVRCDDNGASLSWSGGETGSRIFERVLVATGRPPALGALDLKAAGLDLDGRGTPTFDKTTMRCGRSSIFMAGDADASRPVLHEAAAEGEIAGRSAAAWPHVEPATRSVPFSVMFTEPALAVLGDIYGEDDLVGSVSYADQGRAKADGRNTGFARLLAKPDGRLTGALLACPGAEHLAHLLAWAIQRGETAQSLLRLPFYHPTLEEGLKSALREIDRQISH